MEKNDSLFNLIRSLSKTEKGYFKKLNSFHVRGEKNNYMRLFDVLDRMETYDEKKLFARFKGEPLLRQLPVAKNYLYNLILKSLESYHNNDASELRSLLTRAEILYQKGLNEQALRLLRRAHSSAVKQERFTYALEAQQLEIAFSREYQSPRMLSTAMDKFRADITIQLQQLKNNLDYEMLRSNVLTLGSGIYGRHRSKMVNAMKKLLDDPLIQNDRRAESVRASNNRLTALTSCLFHTGDREQAADSLSLLIGNLLSNPEIFRDDALLYIQAYYNMSRNCELRGEFDDALSWLEQLRALKPPHENLRVRIFELFNHALFSVYFESGRFDDFVDVMPEFERGMRLFGKRVNPRMRSNLISQVANTYFTLGRFSLALKWNNQNMQEINTDMREDLQDLTRILDILIHYELNNFDLLEYRLKSIQRFYSKSGEHEAELLVIDMIRKLIGSIDTPEQQRKVLDSFRKKIAPLAEAAEQHSLFGYFDAISWIDARLTRRTLAEVKREKIEKPEKKKKR